jgi:kynurenine formamidase
MRDKVPVYAELLRRSDGPPGSAWGLFGPDDQLGTLNFLDVHTTLRARDAIRKGEVFNLDYELTAFDPPVSPNRQPVDHQVLSRHGGNVRDDFVNDFYLQVSSQIDGLRHHRHPVHGFYNGVADDAIVAGGPDLGIQHAADRGIVARGVLLDVHRHLAELGQPLDLGAPEVFTVELLEEVIRQQGVTLEPGDVLLLHTGWAEYSLALPPDQRKEQPTKRQFCGLAQSRETLAWLWDHQFSMIATDTVAVEVMPSLPSSPFFENVLRMMHPDMIALLGMWLGELWKLDSLAADCAADGVYECMVIVKPLNLVGGVGSPPNATAIK